MNTSTLERAPRTGLRLTPTSIRLAAIVRRGGYWLDWDLIEQLGNIHHSTFRRALVELRDLGVITYDWAKRGPRPTYRRIDPVVSSPVWDELNLRVFGVGQ